jgi:cell division protein FtsZ
VKAVMEEMGKAMMGTGESEGDKRALEAAEAAISNPLLEDTSMQGARGILINITGGADMTLFEVDEAVNRIKDEVDANANIIFGSTVDERLEGRMRVSIVATGIDVAADAVRPPHLSVVSAVGGEAPSFVEAAESASGGGESYLGIPQHGIERDSPEVPAHTVAPGPSMTIRQPEAAAHAEAPQPAARAVPAPPEQSVPQPMLRTVESPRRAAEPFIAPPPVEPRISRYSPIIPPDPFAEAAVTNGGAPQRPGPSLLERMTGLGRKPRSKDGGVAEAEPPAARPGPAPLRLRQSASEEAEEPKPAARVPASRFQAPELKAESGKRMAAPPPTEDDLLEIPAFLRRQSN